MISKSSKLMFSEGRGTLQQIIDCLSGKNGRLWEKSLSEHIHQGAIKAFGWKIWDGFKLQGYEAIEILISVLKHKSSQKDGFSITMYNIEGFVEKCQFPIKEEANVQFIHLSVSELGFVGDTRVSEILSTLSSLGLAPCKDADALRLLCSDLSRFDDICEMVTSKHLQSPIFLTEKPMFHNLRGSDDPKRPFFYQLACYHKNQLGISMTWREDRDEKGNYLEDIILNDQAGIIVRVKKTT